MATLSVQLFASLHELASFVRRWLANEALHAAAVEYRPFVVKPVPPSNSDVSVRNHGVRRLVFNDRPIDCVASGNSELLDKNEGMLLLDIGRVGPRGMTESHLSATNATAHWRGIAADLKRNTTAGMLGLNEHSGATAMYRAYRYTPAAADMAKSGTALRPFEQSPVSLRPA